MCVYIDQVQHTSLLWEKGRVALKVTHGEQSTLTSHAKKNTSSMVNPSVLSLLCLASPSPGAERNKGKWKPRKCSFFSNHHAVRVRKTNKKTIFPGSMHAVHVGEQTLKRRQRCGAEDEEVEVVEENNRKKKGSIVVKKSDSFIASGQRRGRRPIRQTRQKERPTAKARRRLQEEHLRIR